MQFQTFDLPVSLAVAAGASKPVGDFLHKTVSISGTFVATLSVEARITGTDSWHVIAEVTAPALVPIAHDVAYTGGYEYSVSDLRINTTAYTSGTPVAIFGGFNAHSD